ncbi:hypothetical protein ILUMI_19611 [Ignelater luminosus]|uniref:UDP-glucuronosyltransferase n=1 Tax=Ignelater luminosus TaxID=2038154 RepID=A0A8K0G5F0_IGNLU|nr:hypothetical protein ILUMI_19611 [Ignelater luminosus]
MLLSVLFFLLFGSTTISSARILGIVPTPSYSHQIVFRPLWKELSLRGHQVTSITTDPMKDKSLTNLTEIDLHFSYKTWNEKINMVKMAKLNVIGFLNYVVEVGGYFSNEQLQDPEVQRSLNNDSENYDLVLMESFFPTMAMFAKKFKCPLIQILSLDGSSYMYHSIGNPAHPVLNPDFLLNFNEKLTFFERSISTFTLLFLDYYHYPNIVRTHQLLVNKYFGNKYPSLVKTLKRASMMFVNSDIIFHRVRPVLPNVIQFGGGVHFATPKPLAKDLKELLDKSTNGFIYFSLGNNVKGELLAEHTRRVFLETFAELPYTVLWKFEQDVLPEKPVNIIMSKWFPQQDVFRHPNIKLVITQGGLQSIEEAIYNHIPIIGMPFIADQQANIQNIVDRGLGLSVDFNTIDKKTFKKIILEVINNPTYRNKVKELEELLKDQPMTGIKRAAWWAKYVIRHKGATHLKSAVLDLPDYQSYLLDVISFCVLVVLAVGYVLVKLGKLIY